MRRFDTRIWFRRAAWIGIPLTILAAAQWYTIVNTTFVWYEGADAIAETQPIDYLFIGSSRVKAAIDAPSFEAAVRPPASGRVLNFGTGGATMRQHYFGIRNLMQAHPESLSGSVVFVETFLGVPGYMTGWFMDYNPRLLAEVMTLSDLGEFWGTGYTLEEKLSLTMRLVLFKFRPFFWRERIRRTVIDAGAKPIAKTAQTLGMTPRREMYKADLAEGGGIRTDKKGVDLVRRQAMSLENRRLDIPETAAGWETGEIGRLVTLVKAHQGQVVFFDVPLHSIYEAHYRQGISPSARGAFEAYRRQQSLPHLAPGIETTDDDFPDISHLRKSLASSFTRRLAEDWNAIRR